MSTPPVHHWVAVWPVVDPAVAVGDLFAEALDDLTAVSVRHGMRVLTHGTPRILPGWRVPGSGGAGQVVAIGCTVHRLRDLPITDWGEPDPAANDALDETAIHRALHGDDVQLTPAERVEAVRILNARGLSDAQVAARLHLADRSVVRIRMKHQIARAA